MLSFECEGEIRVIDENKLFFKAWNEIAKCPQSNDQTFIQKKN